ncbi:MAG: YARHG domain-containing protein [Pseudomonadota bacterium]
MNKINKCLKGSLVRASFGALALIMVGTLPAVAQNLSSWSCAQLWHERNSVFYNWGYCFQGQRGIQTFGNDGCSRTSQQALNAMGAENRRFIERIKAEERRRGC